MQLLVDEVLLGDVNMRTDQLLHFAVSTQEWMSNRMDVSDRSVRQRYAKIDFEVSFLSNGLPCHFNDPFPVLGDDTIMESSE